MKRALIVHAQFEHLGGAETYCFRIVEILQQRFDEVIVLHAHKPPDLERAFARSGVRLDPDRVKFSTVEMPWIVRKLTGNKASSGVPLQYAMIVRAARRVLDAYDFVASTYAECPLRRERMIQSIHIPFLVYDPESLSYLALKMNFSRRMWHMAYISVVRRLMGWNKRMIAEQFTLTNSQWTADQFLRHYPGANVRAVHHGIDTTLSELSPEWVPFVDRENNFVILGRIVPSKRIEWAIEVIENLRARGHGVGLRIVGSGSPEYIGRISEIVAQKPWITLHTDLDRAALEALVVRQKWGLHGYQFEHYGLAPGELQALGCITFIHDSGGQREIVTNPAQRYQDTPSAIRKIDAVLRAPETHARLLAEAKASATRHKGSDFIRTFDNYVTDMMTPP